MKTYLLTLDLANLASGGTGKMHSFWEWALLETKLGLLFLPKLLLIFDVLITSVRWISPFWVISSLYILSSIKSINGYYLLTISL